MLHRVGDQASPEPGRPAHREQALSFGQAADDYNRIRPGYPIEAVRWALAGRTEPVVDLGAGTGLLTRVLRQLGVTPVPVEPDPKMRAALDAATPGVTALAGSAEQLPLPDSSANAILCGQAYHWFDPETAHPEIARVLRPGGVFAPIWNVRDESVSWVAELTRTALVRHGDGRSAYVMHDLGPLFGPVERAEFPHATTHTAESLVALVRSRSYYLTADERRRAEMDEAVRAVADGIGLETFELPYVTVVYRAFRRSPATSHTLRS
jgi:SAM-dependent methyltransferase